MGYRIFSFIFFISISVGYSQSIDSLWKKNDTLVFYSVENKNLTSIEEVNKILNSGNKRDIAKLFNNTAIHFANSGQESRSIGYFNIAASLFKNLNDSLALSICYNYLGSVHYLTANYETAVSYYNDAINIKETLKDTLELVQAFNDLGFVYLNTFRYNNAIIAFDKALQLAKIQKDTATIAQQYYYLGTVFNDQENTDSTLKYYNLSLEYDILNQDNENTLASHNNIAVTYYKKGNLKAARDYLSIADSMILNLESIKGKAIILNNIANILYNRGNYSKAHELYNNSISLKKKILYDAGIALTEYNIGKVYAAENNKDSAIQYFTVSLEKAEKFGLKDIVARCNIALSELYEKEGDKKKAYEYYKAFAAAKYSIIGDDLENQLNETLEDYASKRNEAASLKKELQMQRLFSDYNADIKSKEIRLLQEKKKYREQINYGFIALFVLVIIGIYLSFKRNKDKKRANILLHKQNVEIEEQNIILAKQAEELRESNIELEKLSIVASETDNAVLIMDSEGNFEWVNSAFTKITGFTYDELVSEISTNIISESTPDYIKKKFDYCITNKKTAHYDFQTKSKSGDKLWLTVTLTPILDENNNIQKLVSIDSDITPLKIAEAEILQQKEEIETQKEEIEDQRDYVISQKNEIQEQKEQLEKTLVQLKTAQKKLVESEKMAALGNLVAGVSHEINTPVGIGIAASSSMVTKTANLEELFKNKKMKMSDLQNYIESTVQACELILTNLNRTAELVQSFKQVSVDNMTENKRNFNLKLYIEDIIRSLAPKLKHRPIDIHVNCDEAIELNSYPGAFAQIFTNFVINSLLHAYDEEEKGIITIETTNTDKDLTIIYKDDGKGIPQENIKKIFDPFFTTNMQSGTGLGMNITYNLITQKLGGDITLDSEQGKGVTFTITLPWEGIK